jgi:molybdopterin/thiamine biosynthesis adenylyltransferase/nitroreductase
MRRAPCDSSQVSASRSSGSRVLGRFDYRQAFSRNIGWVTETEQRLLREKRVAIAGLGGVGGSHLLTLTRLGIGAFHIADFDAFDLVNFNRQAGAKMSTLGVPKVAAMAAMARDVNPELDIVEFPKGVDDGNVGRFLDGVDLYVDSLDFFAFDARAAVFAECARRRIPAVTAAPLGMGVALLNFVPGGMTFEEYFQLEGRPEAEQSMRFLVGLAPAALYAGYLADKTRVDLAARKGPSTAIACELCAGVAGAQALKILLQRGDVVAAPRGLHFDPYTNKLVRTHVPGGNRNPLQRAKIWAAEKLAAARPSGARTSAEAASGASPIERVLDLARWAPSGDNTQIWRFEITGDTSCRIHTRDTRESVLYDIDGSPSLMAVGALLENVRIAATDHGLRADVRRRDTPDSAPAPHSGFDTRQTFDVTLKADPSVVADPLAAFIPIRSVQRRPLSTAPLTASEKAALEAAAGSYSLLWLESARTRFSVARLLLANARIRLTTPEAFEVHRSVIEWKAQFSADRMPDEAIGLGPPSLAATRWAMQSWERVAFLNRYVAGTVWPRIELDLVPALACAAHFALVAERPAVSVDHHVDAGRAMQRVWLTATRLGLQMQPETTPLIFAAYVRARRSFSATPGLWEQAVDLTAGLARLLGPDALGRTVFMARIGHGPIAAARSTRKPLGELLVAGGTS